ncbi:MAG: roadblock/LC7 domain-containing protein [Candidatus Hodarchaeota archaeon]
MGSNLFDYEELLKKLKYSIPEIQAVAIITNEGMPIASVLPPEIDDVKISAMTSALLSLAEMTVVEMEKGDFDQLYLKATDGYLIYMQAGPRAVLAVSTTIDVKLGLVFLECRTTCEKIIPILTQQILSEKAINKISYLMKEKQVDEMEVERKYLSELISNELIQQDESDNLPIIEPSVKSFFEKNRIKIEYDGNLIKFLK